MPAVERHAPGAFCWFELATTDQSAAKQFYRSLFGWTANDFPMGPGGQYTMFDLDGQYVGAAYTMIPEQRKKGVPAYWLLYVSTESADKTAVRAAESGAKTYVAPTDVFSFGRMAIFSDPTRASFAVWESKQHTGTTVAGVDGTVCWADLSTPDPDTATKFYSDLFGWEISKGEHDSSGYLHIKNGETFIGGIPPARMRSPEAPAHWMLYFLVSDCDASAAKAQQLGGEALMPPLTVEHVGRMAIFKDPQGAVFALFQPEKR